MTIKEGDVLADKYRIEKLLGEGGMGAVWIATNTVLEKKVALKVMSPRFAQVPAAATRFHREAIAASKVSHPSICQVFDAGKTEGQPWIAMELLQGESLGDRLARGPMSLDEVLKMAIGTLSALAEVHEHGIVHRDLKPDNIFLADDRQGSFVPKVLDFGVAKDTRGEQLSKLTATGAVVGTAYYLSPEQAKGLPDIDARADVYAMGVVLFECLSGRMPYEADTITQLIAKMFTESPQQLHQVAPEVPGPIADVVSTCLYQDREQRFQTARGLLGAIQAAAEAVSTGGAGQDAALAATGYAISAQGTAQGAPNVASSPGLAAPESAPGLAATAMGHGKAVTPAPGVPHTHGASHPGAHPAQAPGSSPGVSAPAMASGAGARPVPQTAFMPGATGAPEHASSGGHGAGMHGAGMHGAGMHGAAMQPLPPSSSGSKMGVIALVVVLFLLGAAGTGAAVWALGNGGDDPADAVAAAGASGANEAVGPGEVGPEDPPDGPATDTPSDPGADPSLANPADPPPGVDPDAVPADDLADDASDGPRRRRRRRRGDDSAPDPGPDTPVASPDPPSDPPPDPPPTPDPPRPDPPRPSATPGLTQAQVNTVVRARLQYLSDRCYQRVLRREPNVRGIVTVQWTVQPNGRVGDHRVVYNGTQNDYLARCTENVVRALRFPAASNGNPTPARYPFNFQAM